MRKTWKKRCALMLGAALSLSVLAGCGDENAGNTSAAAADTTAADTAAADTTAADTAAAEEDTTAAAEEDTTAAENAANGEALSEEEYVQACQKFASDLVSSLNDISTELSSLDPTDVEGAKALIEDMKTPYAEFAAIQAPEKYAGVQEKYKSGCEKMIAYLDMSLQLMEDPAGVDVTEMTTLLQDMQQDFTDASTELQSLQ